MTVRGDFIGAVEVSDARARDLGPQVPVVAGLARICAHALDLDATYRTLEHRDKAIRELVDFSQEVAQTHDLQPLRRALRPAPHGGRERRLRRRVPRGRRRHPLPRQPDPRGRRRAHVRHHPRHRQVSRASRRRSSTTLPWSSTASSDPRLSPGEVEMYRDVGLRQLAHHAARRRRRHRRPGGPLRRRRARLEPRGRVPHRRHAARGRPASTTPCCSARSRIAAVCSTSWSSSPAAWRDAGSPQEIAAEAARQLREVTGANDCDVWWLEEGYLRCLASVDANGVDEAVEARPSSWRCSPPPRDACEDREALVFTTLDDSRVTDYEREDWGAYGFRSMISLPLIAGDEVVGMIDVFDTVSATTTRSAGSSRAPRTPSPTRSRARI